MYRCDACDVNVTVKPAIKVEVEYPNMMWPRGHHVCPGCKNKMNAAADRLENHDSASAQTAESARSEEFHRIRAHANALQAARDEAWRYEQAKKSEADRNFSNSQSLLTKLGTPNAFVPLVQPPAEPVNKNHRGGLGTSPKESPAPKTGKAKRNAPIRLMPKPKAPRLVS